MEYMFAHPGNGKVVRSQLFVLDRGRIFVMFIIVQGQALARYYRDVTGLIVDDSARIKLYINNTALLVIVEPKAL